MKLRKPLTGSLLAGALAAFTLAVVPADSATPLLAAGSHCVAYKSSRSTLASVANADIVGRNCSVTVKAVKAANGDLAAEISVPISGFDSKDRLRDKDVAKLLKVSSQPNITVRTEALSPAKWQAMLKQGGGTIKAQVVIGGRSNTITTSPKVKKSGSQVEVSGVLSTKFTAFGIKPPEVGPGGVIAKAPDALELHYNFVSSKVQNIGVVPM